MVRSEDGATAVRIAQARDEQMVHHYRVDITDTTTGVKVVASKVLSDFYFMPPAEQSRHPRSGRGGGYKYEAKVVAVDAYGNASPEGDGQVHALIGRAGGGGRCAAPPPQDLSTRTPVAGQR